MIGNGATVVNQYPEKGSTVITDDKVFLLTNDNKIVLEDVAGWSRNDFVKYMNLLDIKYTIDGYGYIVEQSIPAGTLIKPDMIIEVKLTDKYVLDKKKEKWHSPF